MPLQELSRPPAVTGLGDLGSVLLDSSRNYAATKRQDQVMDRLRGQQLEDVQSQRAYQDRVRTDERTNRLQDVEVEVKIRARQAMIASLRNEGLLAPGQENDEAAIATAYAEFKNRGLEKLYDEMLHTPGPDGQPILSADDILNPNMVAEAKVRLGQLKAQQVQFGLGQRENAQSTVNEIQGQLATVRQRSATVAQTIDTPPQQFGPTDKPVLALAAQMAEQNKAGSGRKPEEVAKMAPFAQKQLNEQGLIQHSQKVQAASRELESLRYNEAQLTAALREAMQIFRVAPEKSAGAVLQSPTAAAPAMKAATAADTAAAVKTMLDGTDTPPPAGGAAPSAGGATPPPTNYTYQGGILGGVERALPAVAAGASRLAEAPGRIERALGAVGSGLLTGDFSVPQKGGLQTMGESAGAFLSDIFAQGERRAEESILRTQPNSERAKQILMRRGIRPPPAMSLADGNSLSEPFASPGLTTLNDGSAWWKSMPPRL